MCGGLRVRIKVELLCRVEACFPWCSRGFSDFRVVGLEGIQVIFSGVMVDVVYLVQ